MDEVLGERFYGDVDGELRYLTTGVVEGLTLTVVWTPRGRRRRIISARVASGRERRHLWP